MPFRKKKKRERHNLSSMSIAREDKDWNKLDNWVIVANVTTQTQIEKLIYCLVEKKKKSQLLLGQWEKGVQVPYSSINSFLHC